MYLMQQLSKLDVPRPTNCSSSTGPVNHEEILVPASRALHLCLSGKKVGTDPMNMYALLLLHAQYTP